MIIDAHAHLVAPAELYAYKANLQSNHGAHAKGSAGVSDERLARSAAENVAIMDSVGTDVQLLSPRPYMLMHSEQPVRIVRYWVEENNDLIARTVRLYPQRFRGVCALPQTPGRGSSHWIDELDRRIGALPDWAVEGDPAARAAWGRRCAGRAIRGKPAQAVVRHGAARAGRARAAV